MKKFKRLTAGLLGAVMALSVCSFTAFAEGKVVAKIGNEKFTSFEEAIAAAKTAGNEGCTIEILDDITANGFKTGESSDGNNNFTIDFNGHTYTINKLVGSSGTETNGMQLLKGSEVTLKNGTIKSNEAKILIQNYCDLTLMDMNLYGGNQCQYVISNNCGDTKIGGDTNIIAKEGQVAFDLYYWPKNGYTEGVTVTFLDNMTGTVKGKIEYTNDTTLEVSEWLEKATLTINGGTFDVDIIIGKGKDDTSISVDKIRENSSIKIVSGNFTSDVSDYMDDESKLVKDEDGNFVIMNDKEYEDYLDSKRPSHSYSLEEGRVDRDDKEDEKNEPVVTPEEEAGPFSDVGKDNPNYDAIIKVYENGWMAGIGDGVFAPNGTLTRGMGAMVLWNKAGKPEPQNVAPFLDVTSDDWYAKAVAWAYEQGIVAGYGDVFGPDDALTTEQFERMSAIANGKTPEIYVGGAPNATRGWVASLLAM